MAPDTTSSHGLKNPLVHDRYPHGGAPIAHASKAQPHFTTSVAEPKGQRAASIIIALIGVAIWVFLTFFIGN